MSRRSTAALIASAAVLGAFAMPVATAGADDVVVCNQAQSSWQGTLDATASTDPDTPARHKDAAMRVGHGKGLINAASHSPALAVCGAPDAEGGDNGGEV